jgi:hypothetical protein
MSPTDETRFLNLFYEHRSERLSGSSSVRRIADLIAGRDIAAAREYKN